MLMDRIREYLTLGADESQPHQAADRRVARRKSVLLRATIYPVDVFCDARVRDISATGLKGEADVELAIGQTLHVTADELTYHAGTVKWTSDRQFGLSLVNAPETFGAGFGETDHGDCEGHHPRAPRAKINANVRLVAGRPPRPGTIRNLSTSGMLLDTSPGLRPGQHLVVKVGNATPIYGRVQWSADGRIGFNAERPISVLTIACTVD